MAPSQHSRPTGRRLLCLPLVPLQYYDLPSVSLRAATWRNMRDGVDGFRVRGSCIGQLLLAICALHGSVHRHRFIQRTCAQPVSECFEPLLHLLHTGGPSGEQRQPQRADGAGNPGGGAGHRSPVLVLRHVSRFWCCLQGVLYLLFLLVTRDAVVLPRITPASLLVIHPSPAPELGWSLPPCHCSIHPGATGHQVLAELLAALMTKAAQEVAAGAPLVPVSRPGQEGLPPSMARNFREARTSLCAQLVGGWYALRRWETPIALHQLPRCLCVAAALLAAPLHTLLTLISVHPYHPRFCLFLSTTLPQRDFEPTVVEQEGFEYEPEKPDLPSWVEQKWGYRALMPGAWVPHCRCCGEGLRGCNCLR